MDWLISLLRPDLAAQATVAQSTLTLGLVVAIGLALGSVRVFGVSLGVTGVLFAGIVFGHFKYAISPSILDFARDFGLILFVYTIGIQVGPGFFSSLRKQGLKLNLLAAAIVALGVILTLAIHFFAGVDIPAAVGLFSGATTNTPGLAAAQQALLDKTGDEAVRTLPALGYAIAYPFGVLGVILAMLAVRLAFRIDVAEENQIFTRSEMQSHPQLTAMNIEVRNTNLHGLPLREIPFAANSGVVVSRVMHEQALKVANGDTPLFVGDTMLAVGPRDQLEKFRIVVGAESEVDLETVPSVITTRRVVVTHKPTIGKPVDELNLGARFGVTITRIVRAEIELPVSSEVKLQFGDRVIVVGEPEAIERAAAELGNEPKALQHPMLVPIFAGISLGVILGSLPINIPGVPAAVKLGLAGGPLLAAILLSRLGRIGPLVWYMPVSANLMLREIGIALFLACVGLQSGGRFLETLTQGDGFKWMALAALITVVPLLLVSLFARLIFKMNYLSVCGLMAGSMTDGPALAFVTSSARSDGPSIAYATVYPLSMFLRVLCAQFLVLFFF